MIIIQLEKLHGERKEIIPRDDMVGGSIGIQENIHKD